MAVLLISELLLAGCAVSARALGPADFPFHVVASPIDIHRRLSLTPNLARADGLIERRQHHIESAWLQFVGLDALAPS